MARQAAGKTPRRPSLLTRGLWVGGCLAAAWLLFQLANLPKASSAIEDEDLLVKPGEKLSLVLAPNGQAASSILAFRGVPGRWIRVDVSSATIDAPPPAELVMAGAPTSASPAPLGWSLDGRGRSHALVEVGLASLGPHPVLRLWPGDAWDLSTLTFEAQDAVLKVGMHGEATGAADDPTAHLTIGAYPLDLAGGAPIPIPVTAQPGAQLKVSYAAPASPKFQIGGGQTGPSTSTGLSVTRLVVQRPNGDERIDACGAEKGLINGVSWTVRNVRNISCVPGKLVVVRFAPDDKGLTLDVNGVAFTAVDGVAQTLSLKWIEENKIVAGFVTVAISGLVLKTIRVVSAPLPVAAAQRKQRSAPPQRKRSSRPG